jgi:hypothetical protein
MSSGRAGVKQVRQRAMAYRARRSGCASDSTTKCIRDLERELARKQKALAEAAALLSLKKWRARTEVNDDDVN